MPVFYSMWVRIRQNKSNILIFRQVKEKYVEIMKHNCLTCLIKQNRTYRSNLRSQQGFGGVNPIV